MQKVPDPRFYQFDPPLPLTIPTRITSVALDPSQVNPYFLLILPSYCIWPIPRYPYCHTCTSPGLDLTPGVNPPLTTGISISINRHVYSTLGLGTSNHLQTVLRGRRKQWRIWGGGAGRALAAPPPLPGKKKKKEGKRKKKKKKKERKKGKRRSNFSGS